MRIRHSVTFSLKSRSYKGKPVTKNLQIRMGVSYNSCRLEIPLGYNADVSQWDPHQHRMKTSANSDNDISSDVNYQINRASCVIEDIFRDFEHQGVIPTPDQIEEYFYAGEI